jgi:DNA modification methylase
MKRNPLKEQPIPAGLGKILLAHLVPDAKNPRKDLKKGDPEFEKINKSVEKFGQLDPIIFNTRTRKILGGHQRIKVLDSQGYTELYTVTLGAYTWAFAEADLKELSEKEENAANIALNKAQGDWNIEQLTINLQELKLDDMLEFTGFDDIEFDGMLRDLHKDDEPLDAEPQISRAEELRKEWGTELGQMWQCGDHFVICGDCTDPAVVGMVMQGDKADMVFTDPPYNINYTYNEYDDNKTETDYLGLVEKFIKAFLNIASANCPVYVMSANNRQDDFKRLFEENGIHFHQWIYWVKTNPGYLGRSDYIQNYETATYGYIGKHQFYGKMQLAAEVFSRDVGKDKVAHPAQRPISFLTKIIENSSIKGGVIWDSFLGSGTTMIACENLGRKCRGCEIDPGYVAVELQRYKDTFPDKEIKLIS